MCRRQGTVRGAHSQPSSLRESRHTGTQGPFLLHRRSQVFRAGGGGGGGMFLLMVVWISAVGPAGMEWLQAGRRCPDLVQILNAVPMPRSQGLLLPFPLPPLPRPAGGPV